MVSEVVYGLGGVAFAGALALWRHLGPKPRGGAFTAQMGDRVYDGRFELRGDVVHVSCIHGSKSGPVLWDRPQATAERLLIELYQEYGDVD